MGENEKTNDDHSVAVTNFLDLNACLSMLIVPYGNCALFIVNVVNFWEISVKIPSLIVIESDHQSRIYYGMKNQTITRIPILQV